MSHLLKPLAFTGRYHWLAAIASLMLLHAPMAAAAEDAGVIAEAALMPGELRQEGRFLLRDWREPVSGITLFRIETGYSTSILDMLNSALERQHRDRATEWKDCKGYEGASGVDISEARSVYLSEDFVSYAWLSSWSCAGTAHPDFGTQGFTFDARTGRELTLEDVLYLGVPPQPHPGTSAFYDYRSNVFAPQIVELFKRLYPADMAGAEGEAEDDRCDYADPSVWDHPSWYLTEKGLYLGAYFARAQRPCDEPDWSIVPWDELARLKPGADRGSGPVRPDVLRFGAEEFVGKDLAKITQGFDDRGFPILDIALAPEAAGRLHAETVRLLDTDFPLTLGDTILVAARLLEPLPGGKIRIGGRLSLPETQAMAGRIICALKLAPQQYDLPSLSRSLPCRPAKGERTR